MDFKELDRIKTYCMNKPCVYESRPFGPDLLCYRVAGKIFCQLSNKQEWFKTTLKTNPEAADFYRQAYPNVIVRGYHCPPVQQPYWNTAELSEIPWDLLARMIDEAYEEVVNHLPKKERERLPLLAKFRFVKTNGENEDFIQMCEKLDETLEKLVGAKIERSKYAQFNTTESISDAIVIYDNDTPVGSGAFRGYDNDTMELKRIYVDASYRGLGLSKELVRRLEADARIQGYRHAILETGELLEASVHLYQKLGYKVIPNYGPYEQMSESLCMHKKL